MLILMRVERDGSRERNIAPADANLPCNNNAVLDPGIDREVGTPQSETHTWGSCS